MQSGNVPKICAKGLMIASGLLDMASLRTLKQMQVKLQKNPKKDVEIPQFTIRQPCDDSDRIEDQVHANMRLLSTFFAVFGRSPPSGKELEAVVLQADDTYDFLLGPLRKDKKAQAYEIALDWRSLVSDILTCERRSQGSRPGVNGEELNELKLTIRRVSGPRPQRQDSSESRKSKASTASSNENLEDPAKEEAKENNRKRKGKAEDKEKDAKEEEEEEEEDADEEDEERETDKEAEDAEEGEGEEQEDAEDEEAEGAEEGEGVEKEEAKDAAEGEEGEKEDAEEEEEAEDAEDEEARKEKEGAEDKEAEDAEEGEEGEKQQEGAEDKEVEDAEEGEEGEEEDEEEEEEAEDAEEGEEKEKEGTEDEEAEDAEEGEEGEKEVAKDEEAEDAEEGEEGEKEDAKDEEAKDAEEGEEGEKEEAEDAEAKDAEEGEGKEKKGAEEEEAEDAEEGEEGEKEVAEDEEAEDAEECEEGEKEVTEDEEAEDAEEGEEGEQEGAKVKEAEDAEEGEGEKEVAEGDEEKENNAEGKLQGRGGGDVKQSIIPDWALEAFPGMTAASVAKLVKLATDAYHKELSDQAQSSSSGTKRGEAQSDLRNDPEAVARKKQKTKSSQAERMFEVKTSVRRPQDPSQMETQVEDWNQNMVPEHVAEASEDEGIKEKKDHRPLLSEEAKAKVPQETQREVQKVLSDIQAEGKDTEENLLKAQGKVRKALKALEASDGEGEQDGQRAENHKGRGKGKGRGRGRGGGRGQSKSADCPVVPGKRSAPPIPVPASAPAGPNEGESVKTPPVKRRLEFRHEDGRDHESGSKQQKRARARPKAKSAATAADKKESERSASSSKDQPSRSRKRCANKGPVKRNDHAIQKLQLCKNHFEVFEHFQGLKLPDMILPDTLTTKSITVPPPAAVGMGGCKAIQILLDPKLGTYYVNKIMVPETFLKLAGYETKPGNGVTVSMKKEGFIEGWTLAVALAGWRTPAELGLSPPEVD